MFDSKFSSNLKTTISTATFNLFLFNVLLIIFAMEENLIKPINRETVHKICSGQVVLSLAIAVKELVENSIDAEATIIDIRLKEYGSKLIEVSDNGIGVLKENFQNLTLKHYTSKIKDFEDLQTIGTLGFRGEALSSLCALSDLSVLTKHKTADVGTKLTYDHNGKIKEEKPSARQQGTTVTLENLFASLPVRQKDFIKNLKREYNKMLQLLQAYCLVSKGIKFTCSNQTDKNKSIVISTEGSQTVRENIISIFSSKQLSSLIEVALIPPDEEIMKEYDIRSLEEKLPFCFEFFISSVTHGNGRSSSDRQFYYFNSRPCEPTKLAKLVNETYKRFNVLQYPFVFLNIITSSCLVDVNVTPDKRQVFIENEKLMLATVKASLLNVFKEFPSTFKMQNCDISQSLGLDKSKTDRGIKRSHTESIGIKKGSIIETFKKRSRSDTNHKSQLDLSQFVKSSKSFKPIELSDDEDCNKDLDTLIEVACKLNDDITQRKTEHLVSQFKPEIEDIEEGIKTKTEEEIEPFEISIDIPRTTQSKRSIKTIDVSVAEIKQMLGKSDTSEAETSIKVKFRSKISPESNKSAEEELNKQIRKEDFKNMSIVGQFNLGFIIARLKNDLFIIDQHASDEKYNFEDLQANTVIDSQNLVNPKHLELTAGHEALLIENIEVFRKNGFNFKIDESAPATKKVLLTSVPLSKNVVFGKDDIDEMLFILQESNYTMCRPSRVRAMFASRACRKSVMIGKALSFNDMRRLIDHMGEIDQPWNCPHGRPTMRHLLNLNLIESD